MRVHRLIFPTLVGAALAIGLLFAAVRQSQAALVVAPKPKYAALSLDASLKRASNPQAVARYVATSGIDTGDCADSANPCRTVQYAVDRATEGDEVRVASGTYTEVNNHGGLAQVIYLTKTITIQGGYTLTNWINPNPEVNPTVLNAMGLGRGVYISGTISPTISGLRITGGDATGLGGRIDPWGYAWDAGGGIFIYRAAPTIQDSRIYSNTTPDFGGGVYAGNSHSKLFANSIYRNFADFVGGGLFLENNNAIVEANSIQHNTANYGGGLASWGGANTLLANTFYANIGRYYGGLFLFESEDFLLSNTIISNTTEPEYYGMGGGLMIDHSPATLKDNLIQGNHSNQGGGLYVYYSDATLDGNVIEHNSSDSEAGGMYMLGCNANLNGNRISKNTAAREGGGLFIGHGDTVLTNNMIIENYSPYLGSGIAIDSSRRFHSPTLMIHNTIARNTGGDGSGVFLLVETDVVLSNTIIVSQAIGIDTGTGNNTAIMEGTLWGSGIWANGQDWVGEGIFTGTVNVWGNPGFVDFGNGNYHIGHGSAALDAGVDTGVSTDIDGEPRPVGAGFDIGADEMQAALRLGLSATPDPVASGNVLSYTLYLTNTGLTDLHATITQTLPAHVIPGGILTWTAYLPASGSDWVETVAVMVDPDYSGWLTSTLQASSPEGARGTITSTISAIQPISGLAAVNDSPSVLGQPTTFTATVNTGSHLTYSWNFGDGGNASGALVTHTYSSVGLYKATVTAQNAVSSQDIQTVVRVEQPVGGLSAQSDSPTIWGQETAFTATVFTGSNLLYEWDFGDGATGEGRLVKHTYPTVGIYTATVTASNAVSAQNALTPVVVEAAITGLCASASSPTTLGQPTAFTATIATGSNVIFTWDFGDGNIGQGPNVIHSYSSPGVFTAILTARNSVSHESVELPVLVIQTGNKIYLPLSMKSG